MKTHKVVGVGRFAVHDVETPSAETSALAEDHAIRAGRNFDIRRERLRLVLHVDERVLHHARHALIDRKRLAARHQVRTTRNGGVEPFELRSSIGSTR